MCPAGTYLTGTGMPSKANCSLCGPGSYQTSLAALNASSCLLCPPGTYQTGLGMQTVKNCTLCSTGKFQTGDGMTDPNNCSICAAGSYQSVSGAFICSACMPGTFQSGLGMTTWVNCVSCSAGTYQTGYESVSCTICSAGKFQTGRGGVNCSLCISGTYQSGSGMAAANNCSQCSAGTYQTGHGMSKISSCSLCPAGAYQTGIGSDECSNCEIGTFQTGLGMPAQSNCTECKPGTFQTGIGMVSPKNCTLCPSGKFLSSSASGYAENCTACTTGKYVNGQGSSSAVACQQQMQDWSPALTSTTIVSTVAVVTISVNLVSSVSVAFAGGIASGRVPRGASIFQLIQAAQFMNIFGKLIGKGSGQGNKARRAYSLPSNTTYSSFLNTLSANTSESDSGDDNADEIDDDAEGFRSKPALLSLCLLCLALLDVDLLVFDSDQFEWANGRFDRIFSLRPSTCAGVLLQPFFGIVGTAISAIGFSFVLRCLINKFMTVLSSRLKHDESEKHEEAASPELKFGVFEFALIRSAHLGLCQAAGYAISVAMYTPTCGVTARLVWTLCICWLLLFPIGFTLYLGCNLWISLTNKDIKFKRKKNFGSWSAYFLKVYKAEASHYEFCRPSVIHYCAKCFFAFSGAFFLLFAISFASSTSREELELQILLLFVVGFFCLYVSYSISFKLGRLLVVSITNILGSHLAKKFTILENGAIEEQDTMLPKSRTFCQSLLVCLVSCMAWVQAKVEAILSPSNLWALRHRGKWVKTNALKVFYSELNDRGIQFALFITVKNVIVGIILADDPPLVDSASKVLIKLQFLHISKVLVLLTTISYRLGQLQACIPLSFCSILFFRQTWMLLMG